MNFFQVQFQTSLNIDLSMKNNLALSLEIYGSYSGYRNFSKNSI